MQSRMRCLKNMLDCGESANSVEKSIMPQLATATGTLAGSAMGPQLPACWCSTPTQKRVPQLFVAHEKSESYEATSAHPMT